MPGLHLPLTSILSLPFSQVLTTLCPAHLASTDLCLCTNCLHSVPSWYEGQRLALRNPCGAELLCSNVFYAGYREASAWFISEFGAVACHCKCRRMGCKGSGGAGGVKANWFVCSFPMQYALLVGTVQTSLWDTVFECFSRSWKQHNFSQFQVLLSLSLKEVFRGAVKFTVKLMQKQPFHSASPCLSWQSERCVLARLERLPLGTLSIAFFYFVFLLPGHWSPNQARRQHDLICHRLSLCWSITLTNSLCPQSAL